MRPFFQSCRTMSLLVWLCLGFSRAAAAEPLPKPFVPEFDFPPPLAAVTAIAAEHGVPLSGFDASVERATALRPGDQVTAVVSLLEDKDLTQWLISVRCAELTAQEMKEPPLQTWTVHTNTGTEVFLSAKRAALAIRVLGPFSRKSGEESSKSVTDQQARVTVNADYLTLGLDRACEAVMSVNEAKIKDPTLPPVEWAARQKPFPPEVVEPTRKTARSIGLTPERERALVGANPALQEFFHLISRTPGLQDILKNVIDVPWWTVIKQRGKVAASVAPQYNLAAHLAPGDPLLMGTRESGYTLPYVLFIGGKSALTGKLAVITPQGPLQVSAGILGVAAVAPNGEGPRVMLQVVSARAGVKSP